jgi:hypothetical protein
MQSGEQVLRGTPKPHLLSIAANEHFFTILVLQKE